MKTLLQILSVLVAGIAGLFAGMSLRQPVEPPVDSSAAKPIHRRESAATSSSHRGFFSAPGTAARTGQQSLVSQLNRDLSLSTGVKRWLRWWEALDQATKEDMPALLRLAQGQPEVLRLIGDKWAQLDPQHMFDTLTVNGRAPTDVNRSRMVENLLKDWTRRDPKAAIAALNGTPGIENGGPWAWTVAGAVIKSDPELGLKLFADWNIISYGPSMKQVRTWAREDPRHAAEYALKHPAGYATQSAMENIGKEWARIDPAGALQFVGQGGGRFIDAMAAAVMSEWATRDLSAAGEWLANTDSRMRQNYAESFVEIWAKKDAAGALRWSQENLTGSAQQRAINGVMKGAAAKDVSNAAQLVADMTPSSARAAAAAGVAEKWMPRHYSSRPEAVKPEFMDWLGTLDSESIKRVLWSQGYRWLDVDLDSLAKFVAQADVTSVPTSTYSRVARRLTARKPREAMEWVKALPGQHALSAGKEAYGQWQLNQPEAARQWLNELPKQDSRRAPYIEGAIQAMVHLPQAVEHFASLPPAEKSLAREVVARQGIEPSHKERLLAALNSPAP